MGRKGTLGEGRKKRTKSVVCFTSPLLIFRMHRVLPGHWFQVVLCFQPLFSLLPWPVWHPMRWGALRIEHLFKCLVCLTVYYEVLGLHHRVSSKTLGTVGTLTFLHRGGCWGRKNCRNGPRFHTWWKIQRTLFSRSLLWLWLCYCGGLPPPWIVMCP